MSVRGERVVYREREREVDTYEEPQRRSYTTVKRYQVPDRDSRSSIFDNKEDVKEDKIVIRRERKEENTRSGARSEVDFRSGARDHGRKEEIDVRIIERSTEREREREPERRDVTYRIIEREKDSDRDRNSGTGSRGDYRVVARDREFVRAPSPPAEERFREYRFERERDFSPPRTITRDRDYDVERYSKTTDYYGQPQPIIIRESAPQPIIIREERRAPQQIIIRRDEPAYEIIEREEVREDQQLVVKEDLPPPAPASTVKSVVKSEVQKPQEEDYYYERRIREVRRRDDDIKPSDSASQYSSDDSYEYVRRERYVDDDRGSHHKLHLAEGALAGAAGAAILRSHRKSQGKEDRHGAGKLLGGAALGALGAEAISRARSLRGSSRRREWDDEDDRRSRRGHRYRSRSRSRSRSRHRSKSRVQKLGGLAAIAAVGALAGYAIKKSGQNKETIIINEDSPRRRSRSSRRRHSSVGAGYADDESRHTDGGHRNRRIAQAGLASAAAAGIWDRVRSKSRGGRERSKSRIRTGVPIVGAGLGGAALAGLYERHKANKEATRDQIIADERNRGRNRSRSKSRSAAPYAIDGGRRRDDPMVAYGNHPVQRDGQRGHYDDEAPGSYVRRDRSMGGSPDTRRRSRSRGRDLATAGAGAAAGAAIAHHIGQSRSRSRNRDDRDRRRDYEDDRYSEDYPHGDYITPPPQGGVNYPSSNYFPPPPTDDRAADGHDDFQENYPPYNPADYPPAAAGAPREPYGETYGDNWYGDQAQQTAEARERQEEREMNHARDNTRADPGNVSTSSANDRSASETATERAGTSLDASPLTPPPSSRTTRVASDAKADSTSHPDRLDEGRVSEQKPHSDSSTPRARSTSRVRFDLNSNVAHSPDDLRHHRQLRDEDPGDSSRSRDGPYDEHRTGRTRHRRPSSTLMNDPYERRRRNNGSDSDETVDLPPRFDEHGNRRPSGSGNDLAARLSEIFGGSGHSSNSSSIRRNGRGGDAGSRGGMMEQILHGIAGELFTSNDDNGRSSRRPRR